MDGLKLAKNSHHSLGKSVKLTRGNAGKSRTSGHQTSRVSMKLGLLLRTFLTNDSEDPEKQDGRSIRTDCGTKMSESSNEGVMGVMKHPPRIRRFSLDVLELFLARARSSKVRKP